MGRHLVIVGGGSAAVAAARAMAGRGGRATVIHDGLPLGGTCLHVGCVPSKYLIRAAEHLHRAETSGFPGLRPRGAEVDHPSLFRDLRELVRELRERNYEATLPAEEGIELIPGHGRLVSGTEVRVDGRVVRGDAVLVATGSRTNPAESRGLPPEKVLMNENLFERDRLPESVLVIGGGYISVELSQMMTRFGVRVTTLQRSGTVLSSQPEWLGSALGGFMREEGGNLICGTDLHGLEEGGEGVVARATVGGEERKFTAECVLMARGRLGNTDDLGLESVGVRPDAHGFVDTNPTLQTACPSVYAAGDVLGGHMLVYTASAEAERVVGHLYGETPRSWEPEAVPWVVFTDPQAAGVGWSAEEARARGYEVEEAELPVNRWPRFSTMREHRGVLKLFRNPKDDTLLGARALCPEGGDLMSELSLIRRHRIPLREVADSLSPYLTLNEGIQKCAAKFY